MDDRKLRNISLPKGNDEPFSPLTAEQIYQEFGPRVYHMARRMVCNETDAEDVTQDVFMQVIRNLSSFRGESAFPTWLHRVTVNAALAHRRKHALRAHASLGEDTELDLCDEHQDSPPDLLLSQEQRQFIHRAIESLPEVYREVIILSDIEGASNAEIGERLELTLPAVKSRLHRARLLLRDLLAPQFESH
jgi:RNA polymerase sigma-70 factor (ECF subfamily)